MAITVRVSNGIIEDLDNTAEATAHTIDLSDAAIGDTRFICIAFGPDGTGTIPSAPTITGWTQLHTSITTGAASDTRLSSFYRVVQSGDTLTSATLAVTTDQLCMTAAIAVTLEGVDGSTPIDQTAPTPATGSHPIDSPSITTQTDDAWVISAGIQDGATGALDDGDAPTNYTLAGTIANGSPSNGINIGVAYREIASFGAENPGAWQTNTGSEETASVTFAFRPAPVGITSVTPDEFDMDNADVDIASTGGVFDASGNDVYLSPNDLLSEAGEVDVSSAINTESTTLINLDLTQLSAGELASLHTMGPGARYVIVDSSGGEYPFPITLHRPEAFVLSLGGLTDGGASTARLDAPATKTTGDFDAGQQRETTNPGAVSTNITADDYTEYVWSIEAQALSREVSYDLRVTDVGALFTDYTVTPQVTISAGVTIVLDALSSTVTIPSLVVIPGAVSVPLDALEVPSNIPSLTVVPGTVTISLNALSNTVNIPALTVVPGTVSVLLDALLVVTTPGTADVLADVTVALDALELTSNIQALAVIPGEYTIELNALESQTVPATMTVVPGTATVALSALESTVTIPVISVIAGVTVALDALTVTVTAATVNVLVGTTVILDALSLTSNIPSLVVIPDGYPQYQEPWDFSGDISLDSNWDSVNGGTDILEADGDDIQSPNADPSSGYLGIYQTPTDGVSQAVLLEVKVWPASQSTCGAIVRQADADGTGACYNLSLRWSGTAYQFSVERMTGTTFQELIGTRINVTTPSAGDWLGFAVTGTGDDTEFKFWNFGNTYPGSFSDWGPATQTNPGNPSTAVDTGNYTGIWFYYQSPGVMEIDTWEGGDQAATVSLDALQSTVTIPVISVLTGVNVTLDALALASNIPSLLVVPGEATIALSALESTVTIPVLSVLTESTIQLDALILSSTAPTLTVIPGTATVQLSALESVVSPVNITVLPGTVTIVLDALESVVTLPTIGVISDVVVQLNTAVVTSTMPALSVIAGVMVTLNALSLVGTPATSAIIPGPATVSLDALAVVTNIPVINVEVGTIILLDALSAGITPAGLTVIPGDTTVSLNAAESTITIPLLDVIPGEYTASLVALNLISNIQALNVLPGEAVITLVAPEIITGIPQISLLGGAVTIPLTALSTTATVLNVGVTADVTVREIFIGLDDGQIFLKIGGGP